MEARTKLRQRGTRCGNKQLVLLRVNPNFSRVGVGSCLVLSHTKELSESVCVQMFASGSYCCGGGGGGGSYVQCLHYRTR